MERLYVYEGALAAIGLSVAVQAAVSLDGGDPSLGTVLMVVGGIGAVVGASYDVVRRDPATFDASAGAVFALVLAAAVSLLGALLNLALSL